MASRSPWDSASTASRKPSRSRSTRWRPAGRRPRSPARGAASTTWPSTPTAGTWRSPARRWSRSGTSRARRRSANSGGIPSGSTASRISPDGKWLATGGWDRTIKLRDAATGEEQLTIFGHEGFVLDLAFSPDSRSLASTSEDRSVRLWEVPTGRPIGVFHGHTDFVQAVAFAPDGRELASGGLEGTMKVWDRRSEPPGRLRRAYGLGGPPVVSPRRAPRRHRPDGIPGRGRDHEGLGPEHGRAGPRVDRDRPRQARGRIPPALRVPLGLRPSASR